MWLDKLKDLKKEKRMSSKEIAAKTGLPERTVARVFSGETDNPYMTTLIPIVNTLGGSLDDIFADTKAVVGNESLAVLQENVEEVEAEKDRILTENVVLKDEVTALTAENQLLRMQLAHKEELLALHNYYNKIKQSK
jgi:transcriptional regulator with XRE-family HTH domain